MKRFLFITKNFPPEIGGGLRRIEAIYNLLNRNPDINLDVVTAVIPDKEKYPNVKCIKQIFLKDKKVDGISFKNSKSKIKLMDKAFIAWVPNVLRYIIFKKYDFVFTSTPSFSNIIIGFLYKIFRFNKPELIIEYRDFFAFNPSYIDGFKKRFFALIEKAIIKKSNYIIVTSESMKNILSKYLNSSKIYVIKNYVSSFDINKIKKTKKIKFKNKFYNIGYVGKLNTGRNPEIILNILNHNFNKKKIALHFIGTNDNEKNTIINYAKKMNLDYNRIFFKKEINRMESLLYIKSFDGVLLIVNNDVKIKDGYGIPGKLYDYIAFNNNIFIDIESFNNIKEEFKCKIKKSFDNFINFNINLNQKLDDAFNNFIADIIK